MKFSFSDDVPEVLCAIVLCLMGAGALILVAVGAATLFAR